MLQEIIRVTDLLELHDIDYVVWKSLENLSAQLDGKEDIDILFKSDEREAVLSFLIENGFTLDITSNDTHGNELYILRGYDANQCRFFTFHCHFGLYSGSKKYKEFRIPIEDICLSSKVKKEGLWILNDDLFCITRFIVNAIRHKLEDIILTNLISNFSISKDVNDIKIDTRIFEPYTYPEIFKEFETSSLEVRNKIQKQVRQNLNSLNSIQPRMDYLDQVRKKRQSNLLHRMAVFCGLKRNKLGYGCGVMLVGHDGAGKSSSTLTISKILQKLGPIKKIYLGRQNWTFINRFINWGRGTSLSFLFRPIWTFTSTIEILLRYVLGKAFEKIGYIVIYDRSLYDILIKWHDNKTLSANLSCKVTKLLIGHQDLKSSYIYLSCSSEVVKERKGKHDEIEIDVLKNHYKNLLPIYYKGIDTTDLTPKETCNHIIKVFLERQKNFAKI